MNDVKIVITLSTASPRSGFGYPLIFAGKHSADIAYTEVKSLDEIVTAGFATTDNVYKAAELLFKQADAPSKVAVCASTEATVTALADVLSEGWRQLIVTTVGTEGESTVTAISDYIESCGKSCLYFCSIESTDTESAAGIAGNDRTVAIVYDSTDVPAPEAALVGATAGLDAGSFTYKNIVLAGVTAQTFTASDVSDFHDDGLITYLKKAGSIVTSEGLVASGEYADIVDSKDYIIDQIEYQSQVLLNKVAKLPYDNRGIASLEGVVLSVLVNAAAMGMIAQNDDGSYAYSVEFGPRSECAAEDISARVYNEGKFSFTLAGAIHNANISGVIIA